MEKDSMTTIFRVTTDASSTYHERASVDVARAYSSSDTGNLADATKNSTFFQPSTNPVKPAYVPQIRTTFIPRST
jgi:hypothetical protein